MSTSILHCVYSGLGGQATDLFTMLEQPGQRDFAHSILFFGVEDLREEYAETCRRMGVPFAFIRKRGKLALRSHRQVLKHIRRLSPDVVVINGTPLSIPVLLSRFVRRDRWPVVVRETQANQLKTAQEWVGSAVAARLADAVVYLTDQHFAEVERRCGWFRGGAARVIPNGVDLRLNREASRVQSPFRVAMVSRLVPIKDHLTLIEAVRILRRERGHGNIILHIAGDGPSARGLDQAAAAAGISDAVVFHGVLSPAEVIDLLLRVNLYVHATFGETMSNSILEAMAAGLPVIASDVPGVSNMLRDGEDGVLVPVKDAHALGGQIERFVNSPTECERFGRNAMRRVERDFSQERFVSRHLELFLGVARRGEEKLATQASGVQPSHAQDGAR